MTRGERIRRKLKARERHYKKIQNAERYPKTPKTYRRPRVDPEELL